jgi:hypothetical protein
MGVHKAIVKSYIESNNTFNIDGMLSNMDDLIVFENVSDGRIDMSLTGIDKFREQAEQAKVF